ncbi:ribulose bisphosphate carboxylase small subunit [Kineosporia sp. R_H_3]|uniref:ribulose bisphosphate carboxylase small subunit n=1 Tax=Kineosporia sp. R_H_3 TaxID=1961848 RepID=UPI000B4BC7BD|nr:ribulose bisphosphate carboxylase small subunit [Kineosporia sp. R_H_3]
MITQGMFAYLPPLTDEEIAEQVSWAMDHGWPLSLEHTDDPHPRNTYWSMWDLPMFDVGDPTAVLTEVRRAREAFPDHYVRVNAYDARLGRQTTAMSFLVHRPAVEAAYRLVRSEGADRRIAYTVERVR